MTRIKKIVIWLSIGILIPILAFIFAKFVTFIGYKCPWNHYLHIKCAGCGVTRMVKMIFKLNFDKAFRYNPLFFILGILMIIYYVYVLICLIFNKKYYKFGLKHLYVFGTLLITFMVLRNIPGTFLYELWP